MGPTRRLPVPQPDAALDYSISGLALTSLQPWVGEAAYVAIESGAMSIEGSLVTSADEPLAVNAYLESHSLNTKTGVGPLTQYTAARIQTMLQERPG